MMAPSPPQACSDSNPSISADKRFSVRTPLPPATLTTVLTGRITFLMAAPVCKDQLH